MSEDMSVREGAGIARSGPVVLIASPHAGRASAGVEAPREALEAAGVTVGELIVVSDLDHRLPEGSAWRKRGIVAAVAAGGDGTIGAVATQIAGSGLPLGILPLGTSNDVARALGVPMELDAACAAIADGVPVDVDTGQVLPAMTEPGALAVEPGAHDAHDAAVAPGLHDALAASGAYFVHALTLGLNVSFARLATDVARRQKWGSLTYATSALEAVTHFEPVPVTLRLTGARALGADGIWRAAQGDLDVMCRAVQVAVVNTPIFGGAMNLRMPQVDMRDRLLDFLLIEALEPPTLRETIERLIEALERLSESFQSWRRPRNEGHITEENESQQGTAHAVADDELAMQRVPGVRRYQAHSAIIWTPEHVDVTLDGEIRARTPVRVHVAPEPLRVLLPRTGGLEGSAHETQP